MKTFDVKTAMLGICDDAQKKLMHDENPYAVMEWMTQRVEHVRAQQELITKWNKVRRVR